MNANIPKLAAAVGYQDFRSYLIARGWTPSPSRRNNVAILRSPGTGEVEIQLPLDTNFADYVEAIVLAARRLAAHEGRPLEATLRDLTHPRRDVLRYALSGEATESGTLSLQAGANLVNGALKSLLASACSVQRPRTFHPRMTLGDAETFVRACRLGQTEIGSFVLTIDAPLDIRDEVMADETPFGRQATSYLLAATHRLANAIRHGESNRILDEEPNAPLISANLCESLVEMAPSDESADLRISSTWSPMIPTPTQVISEARIDRTMFEAIERLSLQLRPSRHSEFDKFVGTVVELSGSPNPDGKLEGDVVLQVQSDDQLLKVRVTLGPDDYVQAAEAHLEQRYVSVRGLLHRRRRINLLEKPSDFAVIPR
ncbi:MAG: hypothetical protein HC927_10750 [Deltaproteobacteria bacterium]|nr:hypothetical protein [Deltaproteobacteria bacterium]